MQSKIPKFSCVLRVVRMVKGFSGYLAVSCVVRAVSKFSEIFLAYRTALLIQRAIEEGVTNIGTDAAIVLLMLAGVVLSAYLDTYVSHDMSFRILDQLRHKVYDRVDEIAPGGLEGRDVADLSTMLLNDINVFEWFYAHCLVEWMGTFMALGAVLVLLSTYSLWSGAVLIPIFIFMQSRIAAVAEKVAGQEPVNVMALDSVNEDMYIVSGDTGIVNNVIELAGGKNMFADAEGQFVKVSIEEIITRNPELIVVSSYTASDANSAQNTIDYLLSVEELSDVPAIKNQNFLTVPLFVTNPGLQNASFVENLAAAMYPGLFE